MHLNTTHHVGANSDLCLGGVSGKGTYDPMAKGVHLKDRPSVNMSLLREASTPLSVTVTDNIASLLYRLAKESRKPTKAYKLALAAILADLLKSASYTPLRPCYRPMALADFVGRRIRYKAFIRPFRHLEAHGFIEVDKGYCEPSRRFAKQGQVTRVWATSGLLTELGQHGLRPIDRDKHFRLPTNSTNVDFPIRLKTTRPPRQQNGYRPKSKEMTFDRTSPKVIDLAAQIDELNRLLAPYSLGGAEHDSFYRIFNQGDDPAFDWNMGGRICSHGGGYQNAEKESRPFLTINGRAVVEVDIRASHLTILHALEGMPLPGGIDPYAIIPDLPRDVVKAWVAMTLGHTGYHRRWSAKAKEKLGSDLQKRLPVRSVEALVRQAIPLLNAWQDSRFRWYHLQFIESEIVLRAALDLVKNFDVPAFPLHDSLIVLASDVDTTKSVFRSTFQDILGVYPILTPI